MVNKETPVDAPDKSALVQHLTAEIASATETLIAQRTRNNFTIAIGPYLLLGAYVLGDKPAPHLSRMGTWAIVTAGVVFVVVYMVLGYMAARVEKRLWNQCNEWRRQVARICSYSDGDITFAHKGLVPSYIVIYAGLALVFYLLVVVLEYVT